MCTAQPSPEKRKYNDQLYFNVLNIKYIRLVFLFLGMNSLLPIQSIAQTTKSSAIKSKSNDGVLADKNQIVEAKESREPKKRRIRWEAIQFMDNGDAYYKDQPYTGGAYALFPSKNPNSTEAPKIAKEGEFLNGKLHGEYKVYNPKGQFISRENYSNGKKDGLFYYYYETGALEVKGVMKMEVLHGMVEGFYASGAKYYVNLYTNGLRDGKCVSYFENGQLENEAEYKNGTPVGVHYGYFPDGTVRYMKSFNAEGQLHGPNYVFHRTGCEALEEYYKNGKLDSVQRAWDALSCFLIRSGNYKLGEKDGIFAELNMFGDTLKIESYKNGIRHGFFGSYVEQKPAEDDTDPRPRIVTEMEGKYVDGLAEGYWVYGQVSHYQERKGSYKKGVKVGTWLYYDYRGEILLEQNFDENGEQTGGKIYEN
jgi:antitoxin component YwqK of YwqJK toxin-antitoxin module